MRRLFLARRGPRHARTLPGAQSLIGAGALERFTVTWDLSRKRIFLKPNAEFGKPDRLVEAGVRLIPDDDALVRAE